MLKKVQKSKSEGFTIIEVLIVLAIAGLVMLIVFLAVPALQRNSRNTSRSNDASRLAAAVNECLSNRNNRPASCVTTGGDAVNFANGTQLTAAVTYWNGVGAFPAVPAGNATPLVGYLSTCNADGTARVASTIATEFVVMYRAEPNVVRCISS